MPKSFQESFDEWKQDNRYQIGDDVGWEYADSLEASPSLADSSSTLKTHGQSNPA